MMFKIEWEKKALKQLLKLRNKQTADRIRKATREELPEYEKSRNVKALNNHIYQYRLRVGHYRIFFDVKEDLKIVAIEEVKKRDERTY